MKTVSEDGTYIDYTTRRFGVRVRESSCRAIAMDIAAWEEYGEEFQLPLTDSMIDTSRTECLSYDLSMNAADIGAAGSRAARDESEELREMLLGIRNIGYFAKTLL